VDALEGRLALPVPEAFRPAAAAAEPADTEAAAARLECPCRSRAELMGALSRCMLEMDADYSDGIRIDTGRFQLHIAPLAQRSAIRIDVDAPDAEFAKELAISARDLARALEEDPHS
jgi:hypothetical protein